MDFYQMPPYLIVSLSRQNHQTGVKLEDFVDFPVYDLNLESVLR
jgi:hypothetical protein